MPAEVEASWKELRVGGGTPLVVAENGRALGVIHLKDIVKGGMRERFAQLRAMGIRTVMITGDNPLDGGRHRARGRRRRFPCRGKPKDKMDLIRSASRPTAGWSP